MLCRTGPALTTPTLKSLADLGKLRETLQRQALEAAQHAARARAAQRAQPRRQHGPHEQFAREFARAVGPVHPLRHHGLAELDLPRPAPHPRMREADEAAALAESLSDEVNLESLLLTDDGLSFRRPGIGPDVVTRLRRGHWALQGQIDLHGYTRDEARTLLADYIHECHRRGMRCLRVVHGKGLGSPGRQPVLKAKVQRWLAQSAEVIAFAQASGPQGGAGALVVLLAGTGTR
jgi:DNA-nicking Smr family endonuclease